MNTHTGPNQDAIVALSLANLMFLRVWRNIIFAGENELYWLPEHGSTSYFAALANVAVVSVAIYAGIKIIRTLNQPLVSDIGRLALLSCLIFPLDFLRKLFANQRTLNLLMDHMLITTTLGIPICAATFYFAIAKRAAATRVIYLMLLYSFPFSIITLPQALYRSISLPPTAQNAHEPAITNTSSNSLADEPKKPKIIWLLFDELDSRIGFYERPESINLPAFDQLQEECISALYGESHKQSTLRAIPSFLTGKIVEDVKFSDADSLGLRFVNGVSDDFVQLESTDTILSDANGKGCNTAIVGMYHPYDRLFKDVANYSSAYMVGSYSPKASQSVLKEMYQQILGILPLYNRICAVHMYEGMLHECTEFARDPNCDFLFAHISVPHGPHIYDRSSGKYTVFNFAKDAYLDSLILADNFLNSVRRSLEASGEWEDCVVLITSDHALRQVEFGDRRTVHQTPLLLKMPGKNAKTNLPTHFSPKKVTRPLLNGILSGKLQSQQQVMYWLNQNTASIEITQK